MYYLVTFAFAFSCSALYSVSLLSVGYGYFILFDHIARSYLLAPPPPRVDPALQCRRNRPNSATLKHQIRGREITAINSRECTGLCVCGAQFLVSGGVVPAEGRGQ